MTFLVDEEPNRWGNYRAFDPVRGYELISEGGGSDANFVYQFSGPNLPNGSISLFARSFGESLIPSDQAGARNLAGDAPIVVWNIALSTRVGMDVLRAIREGFVVLQTTIRARMIAKLAPGQTNPAVFVKFGSSGSVFLD
jgi:hypothetical protein